MSNRRRVVTFLVVGLALLAAASMLAAAVEGNAPGTAHYQYLREALLAGLVVLILGALILIKRPGHGIGLVLLASGLVDGVQGLFGELAVASSAFKWSGIEVWTWTANLLRQPNFLLSFALIFHLFPTGRPLGLLARRSLVVAITAALIWALSIALAPGPLEDFPDVMNPFGWDALAPVEGPLGLAQIAVVVFGVLVGLVSIGIRFRGARGEERAQIKWFLYSTVVAIVVLVFTNVAFPFEMEGALGSVVWLAVPMAILLAIVVAIVRYRLFEIDRIVSRTVAYGLVAALLAIAYAGVVFLLRALLPLQGQVAVAGSTLVVAALFNPVRRRIQQFIDRRFNRTRYDAARTIEAFSQSLTNAIDLAPLRGELSRLVSETMQPSSFGVWLRDR